jgi:hypothetical protein
MPPSRRLGGVGLAACVAVGQFQAPRLFLKVLLRVLGVLWVYIYTLALQDKITPPLPSLVKRPSGAWCACTGGDSCLGCPPSPKRLKITDVMSLVEEKVLKVLSNVWLLLYSTCLFSLM